MDLELNHWALCGPDACSCPFQEIGYEGPAETSLFEEMSVVQWLPGCACLEGERLSPENGKMQIMLLGLGFVWFSGVLCTLQWTVKKWGPPGGIFEWIGNSAFCALWFIFLPLWWCLTSWPTTRESRESRENRVRQGYMCPTAGHTHKKQDYVQKTRR